MGAAEAELAERESQLTVANKHIVTLEVTYGNTLVTPL
jgi:hypothetical protein